MADREGDVAQGHSKDQNAGASGRDAEKQGFFDRHRGLGKKVFTLGMSAASVLAAALPSALVSSPGASGKIAEVASQTGYSLVGSGTHPIESGFPGVGLDRGHTTEHEGSGTESLASALQQLGLRDFAGALPVTDQSTIYNLIPVVSALDNSPFGDLKTEQGGTVSDFDNMFSTEGQDNGFRDNYLSLVLPDPTNPNSQMIISRFGFPGDKGYNSLSVLQSTMPLADQNTGNLPLTYVASYVNENGVAAPIPTTL